MEAVELMQLIDEQFSDIREEEKQLISRFTKEDLERFYAFAFELYRNGKYLEAKQFFRFLTMLNGLERKFWMALGACHQMLKEFQPALDCYSIAAVQYPDDPAVHQYAADCFFALGEKERAMRTLHSSITAAKKKGDTSLVERLTLIQQAWKERREYATN